MLNAINTKYLVVTRYTYFDASVIIKQKGGVGSGLMVDAPSKFCNGLETNLIEPKLEDTIETIGNLKVNEITENTPNEGVLIDGVTFKDGNVSGYSFELADPVFHGSSTSIQNSGAGSTTIGFDAVSTGTTEGTVLGRLAFTNRDKPVGIGNETVSQHNHTVTIGHSADAGLAYACSLGANSSANWTQSVSINGNSTGSFSVSLGPTTSAR